MNLVHPEPKLVACDLRLANIHDSIADSVLVESIRATAPYVRPVVRGNYLEWVALVESAGSALWRVRVDRTSTPVLEQEPILVNLFTPTDSEDITLVGVQNIDGTVAIEAFARCSIPCESLGSAVSDPSTCVVGFCFRHG